MQTLTKVSNKIQLTKKLRRKISFSLAEENLSAEEVKEADVCLGGTQTKKYTHLARFASKNKSFDTTIFCLLRKVIFRSW